MKKDYGVYVEDMIKAIDRILSYTEGFSPARFEKDSLTFDAVMMNFIVIGESAKKVPDAIKATHPEIEWKEMAGMRNRVAHDYTGIKMDRVWLIIKKELPAQKPLLEKLLAELDKDLDP